MKITQNRMKNKVNERKPNGIRRLVVHKEIEFVNDRVGDKLDKHCVHRHCKKEGDRV